MKRISVVTPCYKEGVNVLRCAEGVREVFRCLPYEYEHIFLNDGSVDDTADHLRVIAEHDGHVKVILSYPNSGPAAVTWHGTMNATGDAVFPAVPGDLQDHPCEIPRFLEKWEAGAKVVFGIRTDRAAVEGRVLSSLRTLFYVLIQLAGAPLLPLNAGEFTLLDRSVVERLRALPKPFPFVRGMVAQNVRSDECSYVLYPWRRRIAGTSKTNWVSMVSQATDALRGVSGILPPKMADVTEVGRLNF